MLSYKEQYKLRQSDFDCNDNMRVSSYLDIFQTVAAVHAERLNMGFEPMLKKNIAWVLAKVKFDCFVPLKAGETITAETRPHPKGIVDYARDYYIFGEDGKLAAKGTSQWVLIDFSSRKIVKPVADYPGECTTEFAYENKRIERIMPLSAEPTFSHTITRSDTDHNRHTNNIKYADMAFNSAELPTSAVKRVIINYINETKLGDTVDISCRYENESYTFTGKTSGNVCFTAKFYYGELN